MPVAFQREGEGEPLVLVHANGMSRAAWRQVIPWLRDQRDVIAIDLPGHGESPPVPSHVVPAPPGFAHLLAQLLDQLGIHRAHVAGNSLGGWTALELAKLGRARSVVALAPAGLWKRGPIRPMVKLVAAHRAARARVGLARRLVRTRAGRSLLLRASVGHPGRVPSDDAARLVQDLAGAAGFEQTLVATHLRRFSGGRGLDVPVTVVFGTRDRIVPASARRRHELPEHTRWLEPEGLGHVPMWDDPRLVAQLVLSSASAIA